MDQLHSKDTEFHMRGEDDPVLTLKLQKVKPEATDRFASYISYIYCSQRPERPIRVAEDTLMGVFVISGLWFDDLYNITTRIISRQRN